MKNFLIERDDEEVDYLNVDDSSLNQNENRYVSFSEKKLSEYVTYSKKRGWIVLFLWILVFTFIISYAIQIIWSLKTLSLNINDKELSKSAVVWAIVGCLLPIIPLFVMSSKVNKYLENKYSEN